MSLSSKERFSNQTSIRLHEKYLRFAKLCLQPIEVSIQNWREISVGYGGITTGDKFY